MYMKVDWTGPAARTSSVGGGDALANERVGGLVGVWSGRGMGAVAWLGEE